MYSTGPFCRVLFSFSLYDGHRTFTNRNPRSRLDGPGVLVDTIVCVLDNRDFNERYVHTADLLPPTERHHEN
jgi:hypothetical protein